MSDETIFDEDGNLKEEPEIMDIDDIYPEMREKKNDFNPDDIDSIYPSMRHLPDKWDEK